METFFLSSLRGDVHQANFRDLALKPEILRAVGEAGWENPSKGEAYSAS